MSDSAPPPAPGVSPAPANPPDFPDMKWLLVTAGLIVILSGLGCAGLGGFYMWAMPALMAMDPAATGEFGDGMDSIMEGTGYFMFGTAALLIWLGIGSMGCRRWARDILYATGWALVGITAITILTWPFYGLPGLQASLAAPAPGGAPAMPQGSTLIIMIVGLVFGLGMYLAPAAFLIVIYGMRNVRFTVQQRQKKPSWTDGIPVVVLAGWTLFAYSAVTMLVSGFGYSEMLVAMGLFPNTTLAFIANVVGAVVIGAAAWLMLQLKPWAWWVLLILTLAGYLVGGYAASSIDYVSYYRSIEAYPEEVLQDLNAAMSGARLWIPVVLTGLLTFGYLVYIRRFYLGAPAAVNVDAH